MTRSILCGLLALMSVGVLGVLPVACQSGGVGDPCTPELEYQAGFAGFNVAEEYTESRSFQCSTRICLVNHFQGRVSCPQGQAAPTACGPGQATCAAGQDCVAADVYAPSCSTSLPCPDGLTCNDSVCVCPAAGVAPVMVNQVQYSCAKYGTTSSVVLQSFVCHEKGACQTVAAGTTKANEGKECCLPGTDTPVDVSVCGQCSPTSGRNGDDAVYCSCRCCAPCCEGTSTPSPTNPCSTDKSTCGPACQSDFNYCSCPSGFMCSNISQNLGLGDANLAGAYCIKTGTAFVSDALCGDVVGYTGDSSCFGTGTAATAGDGGT
jgi:hypothetical protein